MGISLSVSRYGQGLYSLFSALHLGVNEVQRFGARTGPPGLWRITDQIENVYGFSVGVFLILLHEQFLAASPRPEETVFVNRLHASNPGGLGVGFSRGLQRSHCGHKFISVFIEYRLQSVFEHEVPALLSSGLRFDVEIVDSPFQSQTSLSRLI